jgi:hypothetical protein
LQPLAAKPADIPKIIAAEGGDKHLHTGLIKKECMGSFEKLLQGLSAFLTIDENRTIEEKI